MKLRTTFFLLTMSGLAAWGQPGTETPSHATEKLDRGVVALSAASKGNFVSWRLLATDDEERTRFDVIRNGVTVARNQYKTNYVDASGSANSKYRIVTIVDGVAQDTTEAVQAWGGRYKKLVLDRPATGANGGTYSPNDCSVGDVDGDGQYELILKWDPSNSKDNSQGGITDNTIIDCYKLVDGESVNGKTTNCRRLWRIDLGRNIRSGAHYTQFMVYDFDGDGRAEMMCKTGPGSIDGTGRYVNEAATDETIKAVSGNALYRNSDGRITGGQEWLTVFRGETGEALHTIFYNPNRNMTYGGAANGSVNWGVGGKNDTGSYGNRGERYLAAVAHLDGTDRPASGVFSRGYYDYAFIWTVDFDGSRLHQRWLSSNKEGYTYSVITYDANDNPTTTTYKNMKPTSGSGSGTMYQNGNHNLSIADVDGDGRDEIVWGSACCDDDGRVLYGTGFGHGDAIHLADHCPDRPGLEVFQIHEGGGYGWDLHDAATGEIIFSATGGSDNGRGIAGQFDQSTRGSLFWSANDRTARSAVTGMTKYSSSGSQNFRIFWDGDLQEELLDGSKLDKFKNGEGGTTRLVTFSDLGPGSTCNSTKNTPCLQADILGDWREEVILYGQDDGETCLAIYSTNVTTNYRMPTLMHDHVYRMGICWQNTAYNQPPHLGCYLPDAMMPRLLTDSLPIMLTAGTEADTIVVKTRFCSVVTLTAHLLDDGTKVSGMPEGLAKKIDFTNKTITITGTPTTPGTYRLLVGLTGLGGEKVTDTLTVSVVEPTTNVYAQGDANHDGSIDVADIATVITVMAGEGDDPEKARACDVNGDGSVDVADIASIISIMAASGTTE